MPSYRFLQLDVFTSAAFCGNPLAVFPEADGLSDQVMQQIAREMNLSETVFVLPPQSENALRRLRIFTPMQELPFAGHPVVGTWNALARLGATPVPTGGTGHINVTQEVGIGDLPVSIEFSGGQPVRVTMTQGSFQRSDSIGDERLLDLAALGLGLSPADLDEEKPVEVVSTGIKALAVPVKSLEALGRCHINSSALAEAYLSVGAIGCYAFTLEAKEGGAAHTRFFAPDDNIPEDPATGSAAGALSGYLVYHGMLDRYRQEELFRFTIEQGDFTGRPSRISAEVRGTKGKIEEIKIGGASVLVADGKLMFD